MTPCQTAGGGATSTPADVTSKMERPNLPRSVWTSGSVHRFQRSGTAINLGRLRCLKPFALRLTASELRVSTHVRSAPCRPQFPTGTDDAPASSPRVQSCVIVYEWYDQNNYAVQPTIIQVRLTIIAYVLLLAFKFFYIYFRSEYFKPYATHSYTKVQCFVCFHLFRSSISSITTIISTKSEWKRPYGH